MGRVGQQVINCFQGNCLKAIVDFKLSPYWLEKGHNTVIKLSITKEIHLHGDSFARKLWSIFEAELMKPGILKRFLVSNIERNKERERRRRSCQSDVIESERKALTRSLEKWLDLRSQEDMMRSREGPRGVDRDVNIISEEPRKSAFLVQTRRLQWITVGRSCRMLS